MQLVLVYLKLSDIQDVINLGSSFGREMLDNLTANIFSV